MIATLLLAASIALQAPAEGGAPAEPTAETVHPYPIKTKYDRVRDDSTCDVDLGVLPAKKPNGPTIRLRLVDFWSGQDRPPKEGGDDLHFMFVSTSASWSFLEAHDVAILADAERIKPEAERKGTVEAKGVRETIFAPLKPWQVKAMGKAEHVDIALGVYDFSLEPKQIAAIRDMAAILAASQEDGDRMAFEILEAQKARRRNRSRGGT